MTKITITKIIIAKRIRILATILLTKIKTNIIVKNNNIRDNNNINSNNIIIIIIIIKLQK